VGVDERDHVLQFVRADPVGRAVDVRRHVRAEFAEAVGGAFDPRGRDNLVHRPAADEHRLAGDAVGVEVGVRVREIAVERDDPRVVVGVVEEERQTGNRALTEAEEADSVGVDVVRLDRAGDGLADEGPRALELLGVRLALVEAAPREVEFVPRVAALQAVGRAEGSGTDTAFRSNMLGDPNAPMSVDARKGQNQQVKTTVANSNNAIAYMALAFVDDSVPALELEFDGTTYTPGENLSDPSYPLARDLHCYTWDGTSKKEAAFLRMILSDFGQQNFVEPEGYSQLTDDRQTEQFDTLPEPET